MIRRVYEHVSPVAALGIVIVVLMATNVVIEAHAGSITIEDSAARMVGVTVVLFRFLRALTRRLLGRPA